MLPDLQPSHDGATITGRHEALLLCSPLLTLTLSACACGQISDGVGYPFLS